jgi:hypothetical protein
MEPDPRIRNSSLPTGPRSQLLVDWSVSSKVFGLVFRQKALSALNREKDFEFCQDCRARAPEAASRSQLIRANRQTLCPLWSPNAHNLLRCYLKVTADNSLCLTKLVRNRYLSSRLRSNCGAMSYCGFRSRFSS